MSAEPSHMQTLDDSSRTAAIQTTDASGVGLTTKATGSPYDIKPTTSNTAEAEDHIEYFVFDPSHGEMAAWYTKLGKFVRPATEEERAQASNRGDLIFARPPDRPGEGDEYMTDYDPKLAEDHRTADADDESETGRKSDFTDRSEPPNGFDYVTEPGSVIVGKEYAVEGKIPPIPSRSDSGSDVKPEDGTAGTNEPPADHNDAADGASHQEDRTMGALNKAVNFKCGIGMMSTFGPGSEGSDVEREEQVAVVEDPDRPSQTGADTAARLGRPDTRVICSSAEGLEEAALTESLHPVQ